tara:strand:- start:270 stop:689 length:420 start_codon:yes stop_codon:yes gene_type:complete
MALASTNAWKVNVEETIQTAVRSEFSNALPIYRSKKTNIAGNQFAILRGENSEPQNTMYAKLGSNYNLSLEVYISDRKRNDITVKHFFKQISRVEELFYSLVELNPLFNVSINSINYNDDEDINGYRKATFDLTVRNIR